MTSPMPELLDHVVTGSAVDGLVLDGTKIGFWRDRVEAWKRGERIAPVTMDIALTRRCQASCSFCVFPNVPVLLSDGSMIPIISVRPGHRVVSIDSNGQRAVSTVVKQWQTSPSMCGLHIQTRFASLKCTADHPVLTDRGWIAAGELRVGDRVKTATDDRNREATSAGEITAVLGHRSSRSNTEREASSSAHLVQQDQGRRASVTRGSASIGGTHKTHQQDTTVFCPGTSGDLEAHDFANRCGKNEAWSTHEYRKAASSRADARQRILEKQVTNYRGGATRGERAHEGKQSNEKSGYRRQDAADDAGGAWSGLFIAVVQAPLARGAMQGAPFERGRKAGSQGAHDGRQSDAKSDGCRKSTENIFGRSSHGCFFTHEANMARWQDHASNVLREGECQISQHDGTSVDAFDADAGGALCRRWDVLDQGNSKWNYAESGFHHRQWNDETRAISPWALLASTSGYGTGGNKRLPFDGMESVCVMDEANFQVDDSSHCSRSERLVGFDTILSITDAGSSPVYDLECHPHHNFVAGGIVVHNCYATGQASDFGGEITEEIAFDFFDDAAEIGVKGISLISDGESTMVPYYVDAIQYAHNCGIKIGVGSNGIALTRPVLERILPYISYLRFNFSAGERKRYAEIMGVKQVFYDKVLQNIRDAMDIIRRDNLPVSCNMQLVCMPQDGDQLLPFARLVKSIRPSYGIIKHCADSKDAHIGVDYSKYKTLHNTFRECEALSDDELKIVVKWSRIENEGKRNYSRCYGPPFLLQMSGSGLVSTCGFHFNSKHTKYHMGYIAGPEKKRFKDIFNSDRYWDIIGYLASDQFDPRQRCGPNCLQTNTNQWLFDHVNGNVDFPAGSQPRDLEFL